MGKIVDHSVTRVECKRLIEDIADYQLSYQFNIKERKIEGKVLKVTYIFTLTYREGIGDAVIEGSLSYKDSPKNLKNLNKKWGEDRELERKIYNLIFRNSITMIMDLTRHLGLPPPIFLPKIEPGETTM